MNIAKLVQWETTKSDIAYHIMIEKGHHLFSIEITTIGQEPYWKIQKLKESSYLVLPKSLS